MYPSIYGGIECCACGLNPPGDNPYGIPNNAIFETRTEAIAHLADHILAGHTVPRRALDELKRELADLGDTVGLEAMENVSPLFDMKQGRFLTEDEAEALLKDAPEDAIIGVTYDATSEPIMGEQNDEEVQTHAQQGGDQQDD